MKLPRQARRDLTETLVRIARDEGTNAVDEPWLRNRLHRLVRFAECVVLPAAAYSPDAADAVFTVITELRGIVGDLALCAELTDGVNRRLQRIIEIHGSNAS